MDAVLDNFTVASITLKIVKPNILPNAQTVAVEMRKAQLMSLHTILISIGSNIEREHYTKQSLVALKQHFSDVAVSSVYESEAVGFNGSPFL